jgi:hypothetical protein
MLPETREYSQSENRVVLSGLFAAIRRSGGAAQGLERFPAKWILVRVKKTRQNKRLEFRSDSIGTEKALAFMLLDLIFIFNGTLWCVGLAAFASRAASRVRQSGHAVLWINRALGGMFVYLGARIAMLQAR